MDKFAFHLEMLFMPTEKNRSNKYIFWAIVMLGGNLFFSCQDEDCISIYNNYLMVSFKNANTQDPVDTIFYSVTAEGNDSVFYDSTDVVSELTLPVNPAEGFTTFNLQMIDSIRYDTLSLDPITIDTIFYVNPTPHIITVSYNRSKRIISEDCGVEIGYTNLYLEEISFPSFNLENDKLSRLNEIIDEVNIEVFF